MAWCNQSIIQGRNKDWFYSDLINVHNPGGTDIDYLEKGELR